MPTRPIRRKPARTPPRPGKRPRRRKVTSDQAVEAVLAALAAQVPRIGTVSSE